MSRFTDTVARAAARRTAKCWPSCLALELPALIAAEDWPAVHEHERAILAGELRTGDDVAAVLTLTAGRVHDALDSDHGGAGLREAAAALRRVLAYVWDGMGVCSPADFAATHYLPRAWFVGTVASAEAVS
jgi:hypothetical protein